MIVVVVGKRFLLLRYFWIKNIELELVFCEVDVGFVDCWVEKERFCLLEVLLVFGLLFVLIWFIRVELVILV